MIKGFDAETIWDELFCEVIAPHKKNPLTKIRARVSAPSGDNLRVFAATLWQWGRWVGVRVETKRKHCCVSVFSREISSQLANTCQNLKFRFTRSAVVRTRFSREKIFACPISGLGGYRHENKCKERRYGHYIYIAWLHANFTDRFMLEGLHPHIFLRFISGHHHHTRLYTCRDGGGGGGITYKIAT